MRSAALVLLVPLVACLPKPTLVGGEGVDSGCVRATFYEDSDGDGVGDETRSVEGCEGAPPLDHVALAGDCDDHDASASETELVWTDVDGDGYGAAGDPIERCGEAGGFATQDGDCDDTDPEVNPGAAAICGDDVDNDCDGASDCEPAEGTQTTAALRTELAGDEDDEIGAVLAAGDLTGDGAADLLVGAPRDAAIPASAGRVWLLPGDVEGTAEIADVAWQIEGAGVSDRAGAAIAASRDHDGDGYLDAAIGAYAGGDGGEGVVWLLSGPLDDDRTLSEHSAVALGGESAGDRLGTALAALDDLDDDGGADLAVGASHASDEAGRTGALYLLAKPAARSDAIDAVGVRLDGDGVGGELGAALAALGDLDGDGVAELAVGAPALDSPDSGAPRGAVYVLSQDERAEATIGDVARSTLYGAWSSSELGTALVAAPDVDGDGLDDLIVGDANGGAAEPGAGAAWVLAGPDILGEIAAIDEVGALADLQGVDDGQALGTAMAGLTDCTGDGRGEVALGAPGVDPEDSWTDGGSVYLWYSPVQGSLTLETAALVVEAHLHDAWLGAGLARLGDTDGLGCDELALGAPGASSGGSTVGALYLLSLDSL